MADQRDKAKSSSGRGVRGRQRMGLQYRGQEAVAVDMTWVVDGAGRILHVSSTVDRLLGYCPGELVGKAGSELVHPEDLEIWSATLAGESGREGATQEMELQLRRADGDWAGFRAAVAAVRGGARAPLMVLCWRPLPPGGVGLTSPAGGARPGLAADAVQLAGIGSWDLDLPTRETRWSAELYGILGVEPGSVEPAHDAYLELVHPADRDAVGELIERAVTRLLPFALDHRIQRAGGVVRHVHSRGEVRPGADGAATRLLVIVQDITERVEAEAQNARSRARFLVDSARSLAETIDHDATLSGICEAAIPVLADACMLHLLDNGELRAVAARPVMRGLSQAEPLQQGYAVTQRFAALLQDVVRSGQPQLSELLPSPQLASAPGGRPPLQHGESHVRSMLVPLMGHQGVFGVLTLAVTTAGRGYDLASLTFATDFAQRCALALEKARLRREASDAVRARERILQVVAHDLRAPLNHISLGAAMILTAGQDEKRMKSFADVIQRSAFRMDRLIQDLLDTTAIAAATLALDVRRQEVRPLLEEVRSTVELLALDQFVECHLDFPADPPSVPMDRDRVLQVFFNLVNNALKFSVHYGRISIGADVLPDELRFSVADTGPGIPTDQLERIFEPYWCSQESARMGGTGLGLAIAKAIVEGHGGRIWAESEPGAGSTFYFTIAR
jgi:PAS domain S-box-containing protein